MLSNLRDEARSALTRNRLHCRLSSGSFRTEGDHHGSDLS
jgi:hypothetical protein